jgi:hypothetical protein
MASAPKVKATVAPGRTIVTHEPPAELLADAKKSGKPVVFDHAHVKQHGPGTILDLSPEDAARFTDLGYLVPDGGGQIPGGGSGPPVIIETGSTVGPR